MSDLPAHRALDVAIATKVMGLTVEWETPTHPMYRVQAPAKLVTAGWYPVEWVHPVPFYSTDLAAAWDVVEWLYRAGPAEYVSVLVNTGGASVKIAHRGSPRDTQWMADTVSEAICRAALATLDQKE